MMNELIPLCAACVFTGEGTGRKGDEVAFELGHGIQQRFARYWWLC